MTPELRVRHAELFLAAIRAEAIRGELSHEDFRGYVISLTTGLDLPELHETA